MRLPSRTPRPPDNCGGAELAVRHLLSTGRQRVACILGPQREEAAKLKTAATQEVPAESGLDLVAEPLYGEWSEEWGRQAALQLAHNGVETDGIVCGNDMIARGVTSALQALGMTVPDDIGVIGFDNWSVMAEGNRPACRPSTSASRKSEGQRRPRWSTPSEETMS